MKHVKLSLYLLALALMVTPACEKDPLPTDEQLQSGGGTQVP